MLCLYCNLNLSLTYAEPVKWQSKDTYDLFLFCLTKQIVNVRKLSYWFVSALEIVSLFHDDDLKLGKII